MMPTRKQQADSSTWTLSLTEGPHCSVGFSPNEAMNRDGTTSLGRPNEDRYYTCIFRDSIELYMVLDGHDGTRAVNFSRSSIPHILLNSSLDGGPNRVMDAVRNSILSTETDFFLGIDPHITRKVTLQLEIEQKVPDADSNIALKLFPTQIAEIGRLDEQIKGGTTAVVALIHNNLLYVANIGDSRAILCSQNHDGTITSVQQLSVDHNTTNEEELRRLERCGLDPNKLRKAKRLGMQQNTRSIGDYFIKGGYQSVDIISHATKEPGTAEPHLNKPTNLSGFYGFLLLMSDGLYEAYEAWTRRPDHINEDIAHLVSQEMKKCEDIRVVAQNVVDKVKYLYYDTCRKGRRSGRLDDITLIVKNIGKSPFIRMQSTGPSHLVSSPSRVNDPLPPTAPITSKQFDFSHYGSLQQHQQQQQQQQQHQQQQQQQQKQQQPMVVGGYQNYPSQDFGPRYVHPVPDYSRPPVPVQDERGHPHPDYNRQQGQKDVPGGLVYNRRPEPISHQQSSHFQGPGLVAGVGSPGQGQGVDKVTQIVQDHPNTRYQPPYPSNIVTSDPSTLRMELESTPHSVPFHPTRHESSSSVSSTDTEKSSMSTIAERESISDKDLYGWSYPDHAPKVLEPQLSTLNPDDSPDTAVVVDAAIEEEDGNKEDGNNDFVYEYESPEEEEDEGEKEMSDGNGNISSYITFSKNFPVDLSWNDISV